MWPVGRAMRLRSREALGWAAVKEGRSGLRVAALAAFAKLCLRRGSCLRIGPAMLRPSLMMADFFGGAMPYFVATVICPRWCCRKSAGQGSASPEPYIWATAKVRMSAFLKAARNFREAARGGWGPYSSLPERRGGCVWG